MIRFEHLTKRYGSFTAVDDLTLDVRRGTLFGLLGPNGAGKTTILRCLAGVHLPSEGRVLVDGRDVQKDRGAKALLGMVPDRPFVYDKLTAEEFLRFVAALYGKRGAEVSDVLDSLLDAFGLEAWRHKPLGAYSHGMKQKVLLLSGFVHRPAVLVVDEPMVGLDARSARRLKDMLKQFTHAGGTVLLTTHTLSVAEELCDEVAILSNGRLVARGHVAEIKAQFGKDASLEEAFLAVTQTDDSAADPRLRPDTLGDA